MEAQLKQQHNEDASIFLLEQLKKQYLQKYITLPTNVSEARKGNIHYK